MSSPVRILCVDDSPQFLETLCEYLLLHDTFELAGTAVDGKTALEQAEKLQPDVILLDLNLGEESAVPLIPHIRKQAPDAKIVIVTIMDAGSYRDVVLKAGADAFVQKSYLTKSLVPSINTLMQVTIKPSSLTNQTEHLPFTRLIENSKDLIYRYELAPKRGFTYVNPAATAFTGYTPDEHYADPDLGFKLVHPDDRALLESLTQGGLPGPQPITLRWIRKDGAIVGTEQFNVPIYNESGKLIAIEGTVRDITERKQVEENLLETENNFKYVFDNSIMGKSITLPSGEITVNKAFCEMLGYSQGELQKKNWQEVSHPEDVALSQGIVASILSGERDSARFTKRYIRKDGAIVWAEVHTSLRRDQAGKPMYFMTVVNDITGRIQTEDKLRESERFVHSILNALSSHIAVLDENGTIIAVNHPWLEFSKANDGEPSKTGLGVNYLDVCERATPNHEYAVEIAAGIRAVMCNEKDTFSLEYPCHSPLEQRWFMAYVSRMEASSPLRIVVQHENITERKQSEQAILTQKDLLNKSQEIAQVGSWEYDLNKNLLIWSDEVYRIFGIHPQEFTATYDEFLAAVYPEDREAVNSAYAESLSEKRNDYEIEHRIIRRDTGEIRVVLEKCEHVRDAGGNLMRSVGMVQDITRRKKLEHDIQERMKELQCLYRVERDLQEDFAQDELCGRIMTEIVHAMQFPEVTAVKIELNGKQYASPLYLPALDRCLRAEINLHGQLAGNLSVYYIKEEAFIIPEEMNMVESIANSIGKWMAQKQAEAALRERELSLQKAQKAAHVGSWRWNISRDELEWSDEMYRIFGINKEDFTGNLAEVIAKAIHPDDRLVVDRANLAVITDKKPTPLEYRVIWPDGTIRNVWAEAGELSLDDVGQPLILTGIVQDITERKQAEEALRIAELRFRTLIENSSNEVIIISKDGDLLYESPNASPLIGYSSGEFHGRNILQLIHPGDLERVQNLLVQLMKEPSQPVRDRFRLKHSEGHWIWVEAVGKNLLDEPTISGIVINYHDITEQQKAEKQIQYQAHLLTHVNDAIVSTDENEKLTTWNAAAETTYGWKAEEVLGRSGREIVQAQWPEAERLVMRRMLSERGHWRGEASHVRKDGTRFPVESSITVLYSEDGRITGYVGVGRDITERKKAEEKIQQQLHRLDILRQIDQGIAGSIKLHSLLETILEQAMTELGMDAGVFLLYHPDQHTLKYELGIGMNTDALQHTNLRLGEGYAGKAAESTQTIYIPNLQNGSTDFLRSPSFAQEGFSCYFGVPLITKGEIKGVLEMFHRVPLHPEQEWLDFMETLAGQAAIAIDNAQLWEQAQRHAQVLEQRVAERTEELRQTNIELERASRIKDEFLANMSHELRTPLNSILGLSETLLEQVREPLSDHQQKSLRIIESSGRHLLDLINDILDLSKIEAGKIDLYPEIVDVSMILQSSMTFVKQQAFRKSITFIYDTAKIPTKIYADPRRLKQILVNLLTNAVKFTPEHGTVALEVLSDPEQDRVQLSVTDTGIGVASEDLKRLFQPFVQVDSALNRQQEGTGLGLSLVRKLTDVHGGSVQVESEVGKGSRFTVNLPMGREVITQHKIIGVNAQGSHKGQFAQTNHLSPHTVPHRMILLVEDNMANILTISDYLESHGCVIKVAHNGLEAIDMVEETNPDIILMDIQMPVMDGLDAMRHIRSNPRFADTPIIALTALAMPGDRERCLEAGANEYASKPVSLKGLLEIIKKLVK